jgi:hypothetical protein
MVGMQSLPPMQTNIKANMSDKEKYFHHRTLMNYKNGTKYFSLCVQELAFTY